MDNTSTDGDPLFANVVTRQEPFPGLCYMSGLTAYDEALINGRWIGRYWKANGFVEAERNLKWVPENSQRPSETAGIDTHAFGLEVDGQSLHFGWELGPAGLQSEESKEGCHATVELRSSIRPIVVRVHTHVDGTGFLTRWLEVENVGTGPRP